MLYKIMFNPIYPLYVAVPVSYVPVPVVCDALVAHRYTYVRLLAADPRSTAGLLFPLNISVERSY